MKKIAINGFGRIGRLTYREMYNHKDMEVVAINDLGDVKTLAYLLEHDTAQGKFMTSQIKAMDGYIMVGDKKIMVYSERDPGKLPWGKLDIDVVVESTGFFRSRDAAEKHINAGAKKVVISAPGQGNMPTIVYNVNHGILKKEDTIVSGASCTTNCLAPIVHVLDEAFGVHQCIMTTVHSVTNDQRILDLPHSDLRRARSCMANIIPTTTGAAAAVGKVLPHLNGKLDGFAMRVPTITGSVVDCVFVLNEDVTVEKVDSVMKKAAMNNPTLRYSDEPLVSSDIIGETHGSIYDSKLTKVMDVDGKQLVKVVSWYDNETSYVGQLVRTVAHVAEL